MAPFDRRAVINGRTYVRISAGGFDGHVDPADGPAPGRMSRVQASARRIVKLCWRMT